jgi:GAF domain-containing protein
MSESPVIGVLVEGARALARSGSPGSTLDVLLTRLAAATGATSGAIFDRDGATGDLRIVASLGLDEDGAAGLTAAVRNPAHAVARTAATAEAGFDVLPGNPGGPRLRTHLPLVVGPDAAREVIGVLALAHDEPIESSLRPVVGAVADLAAVAIERGPTG